MPHKSVKKFQSSITRSRRRIFLLSLTFGLLIWVVDSFLDWLIFYDGTFLSILLTDVPEHELYVRLAFFASFFIFGGIVWRLISNIHEREEDLRLFKTLIDESNDSVFVIDEETGEFLDVNQRACDVLGYDKEELLEMGVPDIQGIIEDQSAFQDFVRSDEGRSFTNERYAHQRADGTVIPVEISASSVDVKGTTYRIAIARDISQRVEVEERLRESEERYRSLFSSIRDAILVADTDRQIIDCNPAFTELFGYDLGEIRGKPTHYIYENEEEYRRLGSELADRERESNFFVTIDYQRKSGETFPGETNVFYLLDENDNIKGFVGLIRDISRRVQREQQLKVIDRILRHNLRNDLNIIMGNTELIRLKTNGDIAKPTKTIESTCNELINLADKERKIVELLSGESKQTEINLEEVCADVADSTQTLSPDTTVKISCTPNLHISAVTNFRDALEELLDNAAKHFDKPEKVISIETIEKNGTVTINVSDNGPGLPEEDVKVLLGTENLDPLSHGSGLGLWLVNLIVTRSNGSVAYETNSEGGSTVKLTLPLLANS